MIDYKEDHIALLEDISSGLYDIKMLSTKTNKTLKTINELLDKIIQNMEGKKK